MLKLMNYLNGRVWTLASSFAALFLLVKFCLQFFLFVYVLGFTWAVQHSFSDKKDAMFDM